MVREFTEKDYDKMTWNKLPVKMPLIEDVFKDSDHRTGKKHTSEEYIAHILPDVISQFKDVYMIHLDHANRRSPGWNNDGLLIFKHRL